MKVYSIFRSIDGECNIYGQGHITTFIRLTGCNLRCTYCDTQYAFEGGGEMSFQQIGNMLATKKITITGGEPLLQAEDLGILVSALHDNGHLVTIETNGTRNELRDAFPFSSWVVDYKLPSSGHFEDMNFNSFSKLKAHEDIIKFVVVKHFDLETAIGIKRELQEKHGLKKFALSFAYEGIKNWDVNDVFDYLTNIGQTDFILNYQLHKLLDLKEDK